MMYDWWWTDTAFGSPFLSWLVFAAVIAVTLYPAGRVLRRLGFSPFWAVLILVPMINLLALWILALVDWPTERNAARSA